MRSSLRFASLALLCAGACDRGLGDEMTRDAVAPRVEVLEPARGTMLDGATSVMVKGTVKDDTGIDYVTVNGQPVPVDAAGNFSLDLPLEPGLTLVQVLAVDLAGNEERDTRGVLTGQLVPINTKVEDAFKVAIDAEALRVGGVIAGNVLEETDLTGLLTGLNPMANVGDECLGVRLDMKKLDKGEVTVVVNPAPSGLQVEVTARDLDFEMDIRYRLSCAPQTEVVRARATELKVTGLVSVALVDGKLRFGIQNLQPVLQGFAIDQDVLPPEIDAFLEGPAMVLLQQAMGVGLSSELPKLLGRFVGERGVEQTVDILGRQVAFALQPTRVNLDETGLIVELDSTFSIPNQDYGSRFAISPAEPPEMDTGLPSGGFRIGLADDAMNQVMAAMWAAGVIDQTLDLTSGDYAGLGILFDRVELSLALPPVVVARPGGGGLDVRVADLTCSFYKKNAQGEDKLVTQLALSAELNAKLQISADNKFHLLIDEPTALIDVLRHDVSGANPLANADFEELGSFTVSKLASLLTQMLEGVPVPVFYGATVEGGAVFSGGPRGGYLIASGRLVQK